MYAAALILMVGLCAVSHQPIVKNAERPIWERHSEREYKDPGRLRDIPNEFEKLNDVFRFISDQFARIYRLVWGVIYFLVALTCLICLLVIREIVGWFKGKG